MDVILDILETFVSLASRDKEQYLEYELIGCMFLKIRIKTILLIMKFHQL